MQDRIGTRELIALIALLIFWSSAFAGIRAALKAYGPGELALLRFLTASAVMAIAAVIRHPRLPRLRDLPLILLLGILAITGYHLALNFGELTVTAGAASLIIALVPVFTSLLAHFALREHLPFRGWAGVGLSLMGVSLIAFGEKQGVGINRGAFLVLLASIMVSIYNVLQKRFMDRYTPFEFTTYVIWAGTIPMLIFLPGLLSTIGNAHLAATGAALYLGVFPGAIAYLLWIYAISRAPVSNVTTFLYLNPAMAILIAWIWLREIPSWLSLIGGGVAVCGVALANVRRTQKLPPH